MLIIDNLPVPRDFIARHGYPHQVEGFEYATCKCGVDFEAVGSPKALIKSPAFQSHIIKAFRTYKQKQRKLIGGDVNG